MYKKEFVRKVAKYLRETDKKKRVTTPRHTFNISDAQGNHKEFVVKSSDREYIFNIEDVENVIDACMEIALEALQNGDPISIAGFGTLGVKMRKGRKGLKGINTDEKYDIPDTYYPKFTFGKGPLLAAKLYQLSLNDIKEETPYYDDKEYLEGS